METNERPKRQLLQPRKSVLRDTLAKAADTIAEKNAEIDRLASLLDAPVTAVRFNVPRWRVRLQLLFVLLRGRTVELRGPCQIVRGDA